MTATSTAVREIDRLQRDDLFMFDVMHRAMRIHIRTLARAIERLAPGDGAGALQLQQWYGHVLSEIVVHHTVEDDIYFPGIVASVPAYAATREVLHQDHEELDSRLTATQDALAEMVAARVDPPSRASAVAAAVALADLLDVHLEREEEATYPAMLTGVSRVEGAAMEEAAFAMANKKEFPFVAPWLLWHATEDEERMLYERTPKIVKVLYRLFWRRSYVRTYPLIVAAGPDAPFG